MIKYFLAGSITTIIVTIDQLTKIAIRDNMVLWTFKSVIPGFFNLVHVVNRGAAFGFLNNEDISWQRTFFIIVTLIALGAILPLLKSTDSKNFFRISGLGVIMGGALGNLIDRIIFSEVTDFLDFYIGPYHWPAFNVADIAICIGTFTIIASLYRNKSDAPGSI